MHIQFLGAGQEVTGSKYLIRGKACGVNHCFMVDYGMFQGGREAGDKNLAELPISLSELDCYRVYVPKDFEGLSIAHLLRPLY